MTGYYDALLALLPASLFGLSGALYLAGVGLTPALTLGGLVATALTAHGLFVNEPGASSGPIAKRPADSGSTRQPNDTATTTRRTDASFESAD